MGGTGEASDFSRPLVGGEDTMYKRGGGGAAADLYGRGGVMAKKLRD